MRSSQRINARARSADEDYCGCVSKLDEGESSPVTTGVRASNLGSGEVVNGNFGLVDEPIDSLASYGKMNGQMPT
ncbi:uncharacterized protein G2W53_041473 [Senna tora]|uniref:Uncharacterized protein n=1 Tax=Senna tora TaxID=362788 RepID=A0A834SFK6_9FABA|nr:uncharacterized protein G2W53_041473 [Senna tora]